MGASNREGGGPSPLRPARRLWSGHSNLGCTACEQKDLAHSKRCTRTYGRRDPMRAQRRATVKVDARAGSRAKTEGRRLRFFQIIALLLPSRMVTVNQWRGLSSVWPVIRLDGNDVLVVVRTTLQSVTGPAFVASHFNSWDFLGLRRSLCTSRLRRASGRGTRGPCRIFPFVCGSSRWHFDGGRAVIDIERQPPR